MRGKNPDLVGRHTYGIDRHYDRFGVEPGPRHVNVQLMDVPRNEGERQFQFPFEDIESQVKIAEVDVSAPEGDLRLIGTDVLDVALDAA